MKAYNGRVSKEEQDMVAKYFAKYGKTRDKKKAIAHLFNQSIYESHYVSMMECTRVCTEDESYTEYGILDPKNYKGGLQEIVEILEDEKVVIDSPYDCTGQYFTAYMLVHVNPTGLVSFVHRLHLDV